MKLRPYQTKGIQHILESLEDNPVCVVPTGGGKSLMIAALSKELIHKGKILILSDTQEIIEQDFNALLSYFSSNEIGVYSAGLERKELLRNITVASIQSIIKASKRPKYSFVIIDECHRVPHVCKGY